MDSEWSEILGLWGSFGGPEIPSGNNFCLNGIVRADRSWSPAAWEVKKVYQDVAFRLLDYNGASWRFLMSCFLNLWSIRI